MTTVNPPHPDAASRELPMRPLGLNVTDAAKVLGVARHTLSRVVNGHAAVSPTMDSAREGDRSNACVRGCAEDLIRSRAVYVGRET